MGSEKTGKLKLGAGQLDRERFEKTLRSRKLQEEEKLLTLELKLSIQVC